MATKAIGNAKGSIQSSTHYRTGKELGNRLFAKIGNELSGDVDADGEGGVGGRQSLADDGRAVVVESHPVNNGAVFF